MLLMLYYNNIGKHYNIIFN